eukprot:gnl/MRDRNA2_/MRDRNA2_8805_c0_seq1.p1 gnl/MRDRNA2_/MRDRNA2_8805_c0~~gnl/MRDRNA2_/MRDRNA2_8805_c0_seq1.p1  ORF type:complete len:138 (+),score=5.50 gnl/MRDRNA2_/MRDRNA2_8805_c0_seq1:2-415(+)
MFGSAGEAIDSIRGVTAHSPKTAIDHDKFTSSYNRQYAKATLAVADAAPSCKLYILMWQADRHHHKLATFCPEHAYPEQEPNKAEAQVMLVFFTSGCSRRHAVLAKACGKNRVSPGSLNMHMHLEGTDVQTTSFYQC